MLSPQEIGAFYSDHSLNIPHFWNLGRKHFRVSLRDGRFVKLNKYENRLNLKELRVHCYRLRPMHVYMSVLNWLFPERVGKKCKARYCIPLNGEYVIDVDAHLMLFKHKHKVDDHWFVCEECLDMSKYLTRQLCDILKKYYSKLAVVFSGCAGFHVHVMDFDYHDWVSYRERDPIWAHSAARFKFTKLLKKQTHVFDRRHFTVSVDPMRVVTVPGTVNGKTGLVCNYIGTPKDLDGLNIPDLLDRCKVFVPQSHPEVLDSPSVDSNGPMKSCAKNQAASAWPG